MLREGQWNNEKVIPGNWVTKITSITTSLDEMKVVDPRIKEWPYYKWGYGLMWRIWNSPEQKPEFNKAYTATGNRGQYITIIPSLDIVVALKTKIDYGRSTEYSDYDKLLDKIIDAKK
jgi:CubicO group peptidase (beta-lactamase class C family)